MCLEGMFINAISRIPVLKYFSGLFLFIFLFFALYFAIKTGSFVHILFAYFCPLVYIIYHFATANSKQKSDD